MELLKKLRLERKINQNEIAQYLGVSYQCYAHYETGRRQPDPETLIKLANYFNVSTDYLLGRKTNDQITVVKKNQESELDKIYDSLDIVKRELLLAYAKKLEEISIQEIETQQKLKKA